MSHARLFTVILFYCLICLTACSHTVYIYTPVPGITEKPQVKEVEDPVVSTHMLLKPKQNALIVIDPGHGGKDLGTHSRKPPYQEKYLTLTTAYMLQNYLKQYGYEAILTRKDDVFVALDKRSTFANEKRPKLFVSIHFNSAPNKKAEGIEIYYYKAGNKERKVKSRKLGEAIMGKIVAHTSAKSRGVKAGDLAVVRETNMPAVLVEGGFLTNEKERVQLKNAVYLKKLALGIAQGIQDYLSQEHKL